MVNIVFGGPGCGKTTYLANKIQAFVDEGCSPESICFLSFTRQAAREMNNRINKKGTFRHFSTLHSFAYKILGLKPGILMLDKHINKVCSNIGVKYSAVDGIVEKGNRLVFLYDYLRLYPENEVSLRIKDNVTLDELNVFREELNRFKKQHNKLDFTDLLLRLKDIRLPSFSLFVLDEAQDFTATHWYIIHKIIKSSGTTYVAGDDDQAIFNWAGANTEEMLKMKSVSKTVLDVSYRLPSSILDYSKEFIRSIAGERYEKNIKSSRTGGVIQNTAYIESIDFSKGSWLILVRYNRLKKEVIHMLQARGYRFLDNGKEFCKEVKPIKIMIDIEKNEYVSNYQKRKVANLDINALLLNDHIQNYISNDELSLDTPRIEVSTIHRKKGSECDNVVVVSDINDPAEYSDEEIRIYYTAITRARNKLIIVRKGTDSIL